MEADFVEACVEEIALEGLDGITLLSLWLRLAERPGFPVALDDKAKSFIWRTILQQDCIEMFVLPDPRPAIVIDYRENYTDPETGICVEPEFLPDEFYPVHPVNKDGVRGSCGTYDLRQNITPEIRQTGMTLDDVTKLWDRRLVLVASQKVRTRALFGETSNPNLDITDLTYCILERIGRSRYEGELMGGKVLVRAFKAYKLTPKDVFYHRKLLFRFGLIKKQPFVTRNVTNTMSRLILVHLPRFFRLCRTRYSLLLTKLCQKIAEYPNNICERKICREALGVDSNSFKRIMPLASPYLKLTNMKYADLYPDSAEEEHYHVNGKERMVSVVVMVKRFPPESDDEDEEGGESEEEEEEDGPEQTDGQIHEFGCRLENLPHERVFLHKMYERLEAAGSEGMTQRACEKLFNITRLEARGALRSMQKLGMVAEPFMKDFGRQRIGVYVSSRYAQTSQIHRKIEEEKSKLMQLYHGSPEKEPASDKKGKPGDTVIHNIESVLPDAAKPEEEESQNESSSLGSVRLNSQLPKPTIYMTNVSLQRVNIILAAVREAKLIENVFTLLKLIIAKEANNSDVQGRIDRKSLLRLISRLAKAGQINSIKTTIRADNRQKELHFICDPSIGPTDPLVTSAIEQARLKHFMVHKEACRPTKSLSDLHEQSVLSELGGDSPNSSLLSLNSDLPESIQKSFHKLKEYRSHIKMEDMIYDPRAGKRYGLAQKFKRLRIIHQLLWYHVYGYEGTVPENVADQQNSRSYLGFPRGHVEIETPKKVKGKSLATAENPDGDDTDTSMDVTSQDKSYFGDSEFEPPVYLDEMTWKRYLPPLPKHTGYPEGWCLISDVLLALPLKIFCQTVNIPYKIIGLMEMLDHSEKQFYPIMAIPFRISQQLMYARKYVFAFHAILVQLCHMGLLSFGHQQLKEKDQVFVYLHKRSHIVDTKTSLPGYMFTRTSDMETFPIREYEFVTFEDVEKYWSELMDICLSTSLGRHVDFHSTHAGTALPLPPDRLSLTESVAPCTPETVKDIGFVPGDGLGAAGLDSSLFCHLYRNWSSDKAQTDSWKSKMYYKNTRERKLLALKEMRAAKHTKPEAEPPAEKNTVIDFSAISAHTRLPRLISNPRLSLIQTTKDKPPEVVKSSLVLGTKGNKGGKGIKRKNMMDKGDKKQHIPKKLKTSTAKGRKKKSLLKREKTLDDVDQSAQRLMKKQRVGWTPAEDSLLLLSKVANLFLCNKRSGILVPWSAVRDVLHESFEKSRDKTSYACQRRVAFAMKNPQTVLNVQTFLAEAQHDKSLMTEFRQRNYKSTDPGAREAFIALLKRLREKFISGQYTERVTLPPTLSDLHEGFVITTVGNWKERRVFHDPVTREDIALAALRDIIHSYMSLTDKKGRSHEMYQLFNQYSDLVLTQAFTSLKEDRIITRVKKQLKNALVKSNQMASVHSHHLSQSYFNMLLSRLPQDVFDQSWSLTYELWNNFHNEGSNVLSEIQCSEGGHTAAIVNLIAAKQIRMNIEVPEQIMVLDTAAISEQPNRRGRDNLKFLSMSKTKDLDDDDEDIDLFAKSIDMREGSSRKYESGGPSESEDGRSVSKGTTSATTSATRIGIIEPQSHLLDGSPCFVQVTLPKESLPATEDPASKEAQKESKAGSVNVESKFGTFTLPVGIASRTTLSMLRNQCIDTTDVTKFNPQDFFLINSCDVKGTLLPNCSSNADGTDPAIFVSPDVMIKTLHARLINHPVTLNEAEQWEKLSTMISPQELDRSKLLYNCIKEAGPVGIKQRELLVMNPLSILEYQEFQRIMENLMGLHLVLQVGVCSHRYVSHINASPWLLKGYKDTRGRAKATVEHVSVQEPEGTHEPDQAETAESPPGETGNVLPGAESHPGETTGPLASVGERPTTPREEDYSAAAMDTNDPQREPSQRLSLKRKFSDTRGTTSMYKSTYEKVAFVPRPWRKPEGWLNRELFQHFIKVVGSFVLLNPGATQKTIIDKFIPILQPVSTIELLDVLKDIGAVKKVYLRKSNTVSLFSAASVVTCSTETGPLDDSIVLYEGAIDLINRIAQFCQFLSKQHQLEGSTKYASAK